MLASGSSAARAISSGSRIISPSNGVKCTARDRYIIIRKFFKQPSLTSSQEKISALRPYRFSNSERGLCYTSILGLHITGRPCEDKHGLALGRSERVSTSIAVRNRCFIRGFHVSCRMSIDRRDDTSPKGEFPDVSNEGLDRQPHAHPDPRHVDSRRFEQYPPLFRRLAMSLPHLHRPTRDDFLIVANGFWERARVRFKWFTIRSFRKFNADDISAFVTWFLMSQTLWILVGTTTFFSVIFATANSLSLQEYVARAISNYLTSETGITIIFESAIVPKWKGSRISLTNVFISRRPPSSLPPARGDAKVRSAHSAALGYDVSNHPANHYGVAEEDEERSAAIEDHSDDDTNYTMFDLNVDTIEVTLSVPQWLEGKGLIQDAVVKGVRGIIDRRSITWDPDNPLDPASFRHRSQPGGFELESLQLEDVLVTVYQPGSFRPYNASIFRADIKRFRRQWLFYDFLNAENVVGQFDNCLFSLHTPQSIGRTTGSELGDGHLGRMARLRIDGVNIDHLQAMTTLEGPISWITSGKLDAVLDIKFPHETSDPDSINAIIDAITTTVSEHIPGQRELAKPPLTAPRQADQDDIAEGGPKIVIDIDLRFRDIKAAVPIFANDLSYVNSALIRPIVAFMNANRTLIPVHCRVVQDLSDFDGSWTLWETGLSDAIALKTYEALAHHVTQANFQRRVKTVSLWSLQKTASAILSALRTMVDPMAIQLKEVYANYDVAGSGLEFGGGLMTL